MATPNLRVIHEESVPIPGGKRFRYEWEMETSNGATTHIDCHGSRIDTESIYTLEMHLESLTSDGSESRILRQTIFGIKGEIDGDIRHDRVFLTIFNPDGTSSQQELPDVPVRLSLAQLDQQPLAMVLGSFTSAEKPDWMPSPACKLRSTEAK